MIRCETLVRKLSCAVSHHRALESFVRFCRSPLEDPVPQTGRGPAWEKP
jgi:hypothetical protein